MRSRRRALLVAWVGASSAFGLGSAVGCTDIVATTPPSLPAEPEEPVGWQPGVVYPSARAPGPRGWLDRRGLIHAHSVYSHDACDDAPRDPDTDAIDEACLDDFRRGVCQTKHDFVMLTDHNESFGRSEFPDVLLYRPELGDELSEQAGTPAANRAACPDGDPFLVLAGTESGTMPVGLFGHLPGSVEERQAIYGDESPETVTLLKEHGAVVLVAHTESYTPERIVELGLDGFEMYNLHANLFRGAGEAFVLIAKLVKTPEQLPHSDLILLPIISEDPDYLDTWSSVLATGARAVTTMGTDCHRNTFPQPAPDGERVDSYRRMMLWFSNHLLVKPTADGGFDEEGLMEALRGGRLYGAFEMLGYPVGFDFHASGGGETFEMGATAPVSTDLELRVTMPSVQELSPDVEPPLLRIRVSIARPGGWEVVAESEGDVSYAPIEVGAYRAEVRMVPRHLRGHLSTYGHLADAEFPFIYSNPIYVE